VRLTGIALVNTGVGATRLRWRLSPLTHAEAEGFTDIAFKFRKVAEVEAHREERYRKLAKNIETGEVWVRIGENKWQCRNCGAIVESAAAPDKCPVCDHPKAYFQLQANNF